jgi:hypothetical protein
VFNRKFIKDYDRDWTKEINTFEKKNEKKKLNPRGRRTLPGSVRRAKSPENPEEIKI